MWVVCLFFPSTSLRTDASKMACIQKCAVTSCKEQEGPSRVEVRGWWTGHTNTGLSPRRLLFMSCVKPKVNVDLRTSVISLTYSDSYNRYVFNSMTTMDQNLKDRRVTCVQNLCADCWDRASEVVNMISRTLLNGWLLSAKHCYLQLKHGKYSTSWKSRLMIGSPQKRKILSLSTHTHEHHSPQNTFGASLSLTEVEREVLRCTVSEVSSTEHPGCNWCLLKSVCNLWARGTWIVSDELYVAILCDFCVTPPAESNFYSSISVLKENAANDYIKIFRCRIPLIWNKKYWIT